MYAHKGNRIFYVSINGENHEVADCLQAEKAAKLMDRAQHLNDIKRQYTASARLFAKAEQLPGFTWIEQG